MLTPISQAPSQSTASPSLSERLHALIAGLAESLGPEPWIGSLVGLGAILLISWLAYLVTHRLLLRALQRLIRRSKTQWDDALLDRGFLRRAAWLPPLVVLYLGLRGVPHLPTGSVELTQRLLVVAMTLVAALAINSLLKALDTIYRSLPVSKGRPIKGYLQIVGLVVWVMAGVAATAVLLERSPWALMTGIGALTAVLLLVFKDTILSLVASIQLASNDMIRIGDWVEIPPLGADGEVIDIALHTVKVQNWDKTITTVPTYRLISDSFKNWRAMSESGGRRIKRALWIDLSSVRFLTPDDVDRLSDFALLHDYLDEKHREIEEENARRAEAGQGPVNHRRLTNLGTFRAYVAAYLRSRSEIHQQDMTFLVRQLPPGPEGVGIEVYVFSKDTAWVNYEAIQGDLFDHLLATVPDFDLRLYQRPSGADFARLIQAPPTEGSWTGGRPHA